eukprot:764110-Hanusia_phi.AAC.2
MLAVPPELLITPDMVGSTSCCSASSSCCAFQARRSEVGAAFRQHGLNDCSEGKLRLWEHFGHDDTLVEGEDATFECMPLLAMHLTVLFYNESHDFQPWMKILPRKLTTVRLRGGWYDVNMVLAAPVLVRERDRRAGRHVCVGVSPALIATSPTGSNLYNMLDGWTMNVEKLHSLQNSESH